MKGHTDSFWADLPLGNGVSVIARDARGLAALNKPAGVLSHPNAPGDEPRSLLKARYDMDGEFFEWKGSGLGFCPLGQNPRPDPLFRLWLLNRLDSATSGVVLVAADGSLAAAVRAEFKRKEVRKVYQALVFGHPRERTEVWRDRIAVEKRGSRIRSTAGGGVPAESRMQVVRSGGGEPRLTLLRLEPRTGRSHQLRVQCARRGLPIVGDQTYGDFRLNREFAKRAGTKRMFLHSLETSFSYSFAGQNHHFTATAPLPPEFDVQKGSGRQL